ncbi:MAG: metal-dependent hydrolase [Thermoplasmata archaeon]|nr:MAG: metal-dependent hydrolase [Thermoplasmata archaeon]
MKITWYGHANFLLEGKIRTIIDPFIRENPVITVPFDEIICDLILVTHGHRDHFGDAIALSKRHGIPIVSNYEISTYAKINHAKAIGINYGGDVKVKGIKVTMVQALHSSGIDFSKLNFSGGNPAGFIIEEEKTVYHTGDTSLFLDMKLIGEIYRPDVLLVPIGGLFTMKPEHAAKAAQMIKSPIVVPMHYNTFSEIKQDPIKFKRMVESMCDAEVIICEIGTPFEV